MQRKPCKCERSERSAERSPCVHRSEQEHASAFSTRASEKGARSVYPLLRLSRNDAPCSPSNLAICREIRERARQDSNLWPSVP
jgi:hypothetical protein